MLQYLNFCLNAFEPVHFLSIVYFVLQVNIGSNIPAIPPLVVIPERRIPIDRTQCDSVPHSMMPTLYHTFTVASTVQTWTSTMDTTYTLSSTQNPAVQTQPPAVSTKNVSETLSSAVYSTATVTSTERTTPSAGTKSTLL